MDEGSVVDGEHLDFQKAFDEVPHRRLLAKVMACGVAGQVLTGLETGFVNGRKGWL